MMTTLGVVFDFRLFQLELEPNQSINRNELLTNYQRHTRLKSFFKVSRVFLAREKIIWFRSEETAKRIKHQTAMPKLSLNEFKLRLEEAAEKLQENKMKKQYSSGYLLALYWDNADFGKQDCDSLSSVLILWIPDKAGSS